MHLHRAARGRPWDVAGRSRPRPLDLHLEAGLVELEQRLVGLDKPVDGLLVRQVLGELGEEPRRDEEALALEAQLGLLDDALVHVDVRLLLAVLEAERPVEVVEDGRLRPLVQLVVEQCPDGDADLLAGVVLVRVDG